MGNTNGVNIGVVGATGQVGAVVRRLLEERDFPVAEIRYFASARSAPARRCRGRARTIVVEDAATADPSGPRHRDLLGRRHASRRPRRRASPPPASLVIDNSSGWRMDPEVPLVVSEVNPHAIDEARKGIIANPNCTTMAAMPVLKVLRRRGRPRAPHRQHLPGRLAAPVSPAARSCSSRCGPPSRRTRSGSCTTAAPSTMPAAAEVPAHDRVRRDPARRLHRRRRRLRDRRGEEAPQREPQDPRAARACSSSGTCVRVPVFTGHSLSINAEFAEPDHARARDASCWRMPRASRSSDVPDAARGGRHRPELRRSHPPGRGRARRPRPRAVHLERQPAQGRGAERRADRGARRREAARRRLGGRSRHPLGCRVRTTVMTESRATRGRSSRGRASRSARRRRGCRGIRSPAGGVLGGRAEAAPRAARATERRSSRSTATRTRGAPARARPSGAGRRSSARAGLVRVQSQRRRARLREQPRIRRDDLVDRIVEQDPPPDIVIVTMGLNDNFSMPAAADDIEAAIDADLQRLQGRTARRAARRRRAVLVHRRAARLGRARSSDGSRPPPTASAPTTSPAPRAGSRGIPSGWPPTASTRTTTATPRSPGAWTPSSIASGSEAGSPARSGGSPTPRRRVQIDLSTSRSERS